MNRGDESGEGFSDDDHLGLALLLHSEWLSFSTTPRSIVSSREYYLGHLTESHSLSLFVLITQVDCWFAPLRQLFKTVDGRSFDITSSLRYHIAKLPTLPLDPIEHHAIQVSTPVSPVRRESPLTVSCLDSLHFRVLCSFSLRELLPLLSLLRVISQTTPWKSGA